MEREDGGGRPELGFAEARGRRRLEAREDVGAVEEPRRRMEERWRRRGGRSCAGISDRGGGRS